MNIEGLKKFTLPNGMRIIARRNPANPTVSFQFRTSSGSADDADEKTGLTGLSSSLITKGSAKHSAAAIAESIDSLGMEIGFSGGKHTGSLGGKVLADVLPKALALAREVLSTPAPPKDEMDRMRQRIITGLMMKLDEPAAVATDKMAEMIFGADHPYGRPARRALETMPNLTLDDVHGWYEQRIRPGAFIGVIVGDIDLGEVEKIVTRTLGSWKGGGEFALTPATNVAVPAEPKFERMEMPGKTQSDVALGFPGIRRSDADYYALLAGNTALGRLSLGGRIGQRVRDAEGMAYYAYTTFDAGVGAGPFMFRAGVAPQNVDRAVELALEEMVKVRKEGLTAEEVNDSVVYLAGSMARQTETNGGMAATIMNQELYGLGDDYYLRFPDIMRALSLDDVNAALGRHLHPEGYCLAVAGPPNQ